MAALYLTVNKLVVVLEKGPLNVCVCVCVRLAKINFFNREINRD